jgi:UDP-glucose 4-epimerase
VKVENADPVHDPGDGGTARLVSSVQNGVRKFIYSSSGGTVYGEPESLPVTEEHAIAPRSNYGTSKYVGELYVQLAARTSGIDYTIFRYGNAFGPRQDPHGEAGVIAIFTGLMLAGEQCTIDGDGEQKKDYIYVGDIARMSPLLVAAWCKGTGEGITVTHLQRVGRATGHPARLASPATSLLLARLFPREARTGWEPQVGFEEGVGLSRPCVILGARAAARLKVIEEVAHRLLASRRTSAMPRTQTMSPAPSRRAEEHGPAQAVAVIMPPARGSSPPTASGAAAPTR